jgi:hypothetical protein
MRAKAAAISKDFNSSTIALPYAACECGWFVTTETAEQAWSRHLAHRLLRHRVRVYIKARV